MASEARIKLQKSLEDIAHLLDLYAAAELLYEGENDTVPPGMDVLFRSAVVLLVSHWEAYIEDICSEALEHIVTHALDAESLPLEIKQTVATEIKKAPNEIEVWKLADAGWRDYLKKRLEPLQESRNRSFNTPKAHSTVEFVAKTIGLKDISEAWKIEGLDTQAICQKLDKLIEVRGQIAHRGKVTSKIDKAWIEDHRQFLLQVVGKTGGRIKTHVKKITNKDLW